MNEQHRLLRNLTFVVQTSSVADWIEDLRERGDVMTAGSRTEILRFAADLAVGFAEVIVLQTTVSSACPPSFLALCAWCLSLVITDAIASLFIPRIQDSAAVSHKFVFLVDALMW